MRVINILDQLRATHPVSPRSQQPHLPKPNIGRQCSRGSFQPHRGMRQDSVVRAKSLYRQTADHQHDPPPPHHGFVFPCVRGLGPINQTCKDVDRTPQDDPGSLPMKAQCDSPHCRPPRICPLPVHSSRMRSVPSPPTIRMMIQPTRLRLRWRL